MSAAKYLLQASLVAFLGCKTSESAKKSAHDAALDQDHARSRTGKGKTRDGRGRAPEGAGPVDEMAPQGFDEPDVVGPLPPPGTDATTDSPSMGDSSTTSTEPAPAGGDETGRSPDAGGAVATESGEPPAPPPATPPSPPTIYTEEDQFKAMPAGVEQLKVLCARPGQDKVRKVFCGPNPPRITSLVDLQRVLGLGISDPTRTDRNDNGERGNAAFTFTAGSSSLVGKFTSAINPRLIMFTPPTGQRIPDLVVMGFVRGEQFVELIAGDPSTKQLNFFLVRFEQACNERPGGCTRGELLTPAVESDWRHVTIYEDHDIKNTTVDCKQCHQPGGEGTPKILRMQELRNPWTHFLRNNNDGGKALIADYEAAHGTEETYAGIPGAMIAASEPRLLEDLVRDNGFGDQPNEFPSRRIEREVQSSSRGQPEDNSTPGKSETWTELYERFVRGEAIAPPYHDVKVTDPRKLATMTKAYQDYRAGILARDELPDIRDVLLDAGLRDMGYMVKAGQSGAGILVNACAQCHNSLLDQTISRARFDVDLSRMSRAEKDLAIRRLTLPAHDVRKMPPDRVRSLTPQEVELLIKELQK